MSNLIEIDESKAIRLMVLFDGPEYKHLAVNPMSLYVKVGEGQMENN